jgi:hypothetical protein
VLVQKASFVFVHFLFLGDVSDVMFYSTKHVLRLGFVNGVKGKVLGVKSLVPIEQPLQKDEYVVGSGLASSLEPSAFFMTTKAGYSMQNAVPNVTLMVAGGGMMGYQSFSLQKPVVGRKFGGALLSSLGREANQNVPWAMLSFVIPAVESIKWKYMQFPNDFTKIMELRVSQSFVRSGSTSLAYFVSQSLYSTQPNHTLYLLTVFDEASATGLNFPRPILNLHSQWTYANEELYDYSPITSSLYYEQPPNLGNASSGLVSVILQDSSGTNFGILDFSTFASPDEHVTQLEVKDAESEGCMMLQNNQCLSGESCWYYFLGRGTSDIPESDCNDQ